MAPFPLPSLPLPSRHVAPSPLPRRTSGRVEEEEGAAMTVGELMARQVEAANVLLLNKLDLFAAGHVTSKLILSMEKQ